jgi:hypothetical protein
MQKWKGAVQEGEEGPRKRRRMKSKKMKEMERST